MIEKASIEMIASCVLCTIVLTSSLTAAGRFSLGSNLTRNALAMPSQSAGTGSDGLKTTRESPLACNALALNQQQRKRIHELLDGFKVRIEGVDELSDGYSMRFSNAPSNIAELGEYIGLERLCCPFFDFAIKADRERGAVHISLTGRNGVKEFARAEFDVGNVSQDRDGEDASSRAPSPLICNDRALTSGQLQRLTSLLREFRAAKSSVRELPDGYAISLPADERFIQDVAEYMVIVRLCSPYFETTLSVEREGGPVWLSVTGRDGVKRLAKTELGL